MQDLSAAEQPSWKKCFRDAVFELDPYQMKGKLEAARTAIEKRIIEINSHGMLYSLELEELSDAQHTLSILQGSECAS
jgi:hypothetical protein